MATRLIKNNTSTLLFCILFYCLFTLLCKSEREITLNVPQVLLPIIPESGLKTNYTLKAVDGCFTWKSTRPDIASVRPLYLPERPDCSRQAVVTSETDTINRLSTVVFAEEQTTGNALRCDVLVDAIHRIAILTTTRELLVEEAPEQFQILAYDQEGNVFSSLGGLKFHWSIQLDNENQLQKFNPESIIELVKFSGSNYEADDVIKDLESRGFHGDRILIQGLNTGTAMVHSRLLEHFPLGPKVSEDSVRVIVVENIVLKPATDVYILPQSYVDYKVERKKHRKIEFLKVPSEQYQLSVLNSTVGYIHNEKPRFIGLQLGYTDVLLKDINMAGLGVTHSTRTPSASVHVVLPARIGFDVKPGGVWVLEEGRIYHISALLYDKNNHVILLQDDITLDTTIPNTYFNLHSESHNQSYFVVTPIKTGTTELTSKLNSINLIDGNMKQRQLQLSLTKIQSVTIYERLSLNPKVLCLLWDLSSNHSYHALLEASGGSGEYSWSIHDQNIASIFQFGKVTGISRGHTQAKCSDKANNLHFITSDVFVVPPHSMHFLPSQVEVEIGTAIILALQVFANVIINGRNQNIAFLDCSRMKLDIIVTNDEIFKLTRPSSFEKDELPKDACLGIEASAISIGHTKVTAIYKDSGIHLSASITIAAFPKLRSLDPKNGVAVVTLASSWLFTFEGGPQPWVLEPQTYEERLVNESDYVIASRRGSSTIDHQYLINCDRICEKFLTLHVTNAKSSKNQFPAHVSATVMLFCTVPVSVQLIPLPHPPPNCPLLLGQGAVPSFAISKKEFVNVEVILFDAENRRFDNFSSLNWRWSVSDTEVLEVSTYDLTHEKRFSILTCKIFDEPNESHLNIISDSYREDHLVAMDLPIYTSLQSHLTHTILILIRNDPILSPSHLNIFNSELNLVYMNISGGSGHFSISSTSISKLQLVEAIHNPVLSAVQIVPINDGYGTLVAEDLCLSPNYPAKASFLISPIHSVEIQAMDKVQFGESIIALVKVLDSSLSPFPADQHLYMLLSMSLRRDIILVSLAPPSYRKSLTDEQLKFTSVYLLTGKTVGFTHLTFNATSSGGNIVTSRPHEIQVFDPLSLNPKLIVLLIGCVYHIQYSGGPNPHASIKFNNTNNTVASINAGGLISTHVEGETEVTGSSQALNPISGSHVSYMDKVKVFVVKLTGVKIFIVEKYLVEGSEVPVRAKGFFDDFPFYFSAPLNGVEFRWSVTNTDAVNLRSVYSASGVEIIEEKAFGARILARNIGASTIHLEVLCQPGICTPEGVTFHDQLIIQVIPALRLLHPLSGRLLMPQSGFTQIVTNRDSNTHLIYQLLSPCSGTINNNNNNDNNNNSNRHNKVYQVITLGERGEVHSGASIGNDVILISSQDFGINQTISLHVEVKNIEGINLSPQSNISALDSTDQHAYPLGFHAVFVVYLQDNLGRNFSPAHIKLDFVLNRFDIIVLGSVDANNTFWIKPTNQGYAVLKVSIQSLPHISCYLGVRGDYAIIPTHPNIHVGSRVHFRLHLLEAKGSWSSADENILEIDSKTGFAVAKSRGATKLIHSISSMGETSMEVNIHSVDFAKFEDISWESVTNFPTEINTFYRLAVKFYHSNELIKFTPLFENSSNPDSLYIRQIYHACEISVSYENSRLSIHPFTVEATFDAKSNTYFCDLIPNTESKNLLECAITNYPNYVISIQAIVDVKDTYSFESQAIDIPFIPAFHLATTFVTFRPGNLHTTIDIVSVDKHKQHLSLSFDKNFFRAELKLTQRPYVLNIILLKSQLQSFSAHVTVTSSLTGQSVPVTVFYNNSFFQPVGGLYNQPTSDVFTTNLFGVVIGIVIGMAVIICFFACHGSSSSSGIVGGFSQTLPPVPSPGTFSPGQTSTRYSPPSSSPISRSQIMSSTLRTSPYNTPTNTRPVQLYSQIQT